MTEGFFDLSQSRTTYTGKPQSCIACGLYKEVLSPKMEPYGKFKRGIMNIGEGPGEEEDRRGRPWQGRVGQALQRAYDKLGFDLFDDCVNLNSVNCRPTDKSGNNRTPTSHEITCCRHVKVLPALAEYKPKVIILLGGSALAGLLGYRWGENLGAISRWRGWTIPDQEFNAWICPVFHPSYVERESQEHITTIWMQDLKRALSMVDKPFPKLQPHKILFPEDLSVLESISDPFAIDFETTGLKPHDTEKHSIPCMSVSDGERTFAFLTPHDIGRLRIIKHLLAGSKGKIGANIKFEHCWARNILKVEIRNWVHDVMIAAHVIDNRPDICGVKFQAYANFGAPDYSSEIAPYLKSDKKSGNSINTVHKLIASESGRVKLLTYCGMDSYYEYKLAMKQMSYLKGE